LDSYQLVSLSKGMKSDEIVEIGEDRLLAIVEKIDNKSVELLGEDHLSSMMSGMQGKQIGGLEDIKKVAIVDNLNANFFESDKVGFEEISNAVAESSRPTISPEKIGNTAIATADRAVSIFGREGLFG